MQNQAAHASRETGVAALLWRSRALVTALLVLGAAAGLGVAFMLPVVSTAEVRAAVGAQDLAAQSVPGYVASLPNLTSTYARYVETTSQALDPIAESVDVDPATVKGVTASPIPESGILRIEVAGTDADGAVRLVAALAGELQNELAASGTNADQAALVLSDRSSELAEAQVAVNDAQSRIDTLTAAGAPEQQLDQARAAWAQASSAAAVAEVRQQAAGEAYRRAYVDGGATSVTVVREATITGTDRASNIQRFLLLGLVVGGVAGAGAAWARRDRASTVQTNRARSADGSPLAATARPAADPGTPVPAASDDTLSGSPAVDPAAAGGPAFGSTSTARP